MNPPAITPSGEYRSVVGQGKFHIQSLTNRKGELNNHPLVGQPYATASFEDMIALARNPVICAKGDAYWTLATAANGPDARKFGYQEEHGVFIFFLGDIDRGNKSLSEIVTAMQTILPGTRVLINSTSTATADDKKWHMTVALDRRIPHYLSFKAYQLAFFNRLTLLGITPDQALARPAQLFYLPSKVSEDSYYEHTLIDGDPYDVAAGVLAHDARAIFEQLYREKVKTEQIPTTNKDDTRSLIGWFNSRYSAETLMEQYAYQFDGKEWSSPYQQASGGGHATMIRPDGTWFSFSHSDAAAGLGRECANGRRGDGFDLMLHYGFRNDMRAALEWVSDVRRRADPIDPRMVEAVTKMLGGAVQ